MDYFDDYDLVIFDCDGVILDANNMKIDVMRETLIKVDFPKDSQETAIQSFKENFGKSRFLHAQHFVEGILGRKSEELIKKIVSTYTDLIEENYISTDMTQGFFSLLDTLSNKKLYVASGSEEKQLIRTFKARNIDSHFLGIYGSPTLKSKNVENILASNLNERAVLVGDSVADFEAAKENSIDFIFYKPYSNVKKQMDDLASIHGFCVIEQFEAL